MSPRPRARAARPAVRPSSRPASRKSASAAASIGGDLTERQWAWLLCALLGASALLKLYHLTAPALDWHSWKQVTTLAKARYIYRDGLVSFFVPRVDLFTGVDVDSNKGFAEVPILHLLMACGYWLIGGEAEWVGRAWGIVFSLVGGLYLAALVRGRLPSFAAAAALAVYAFSPMDTYFHRTLITDVPMTAMSVMGMYHFVRWMEDGRPRDAIGCAAGTALAALFKPYALYLGVAYVWVILRREGWRGLYRPGHLAIGAASVAPIAAWLAYGYLYFADKPGVGRNLTASTELLGSWRELFDGDYYAALWARLGDFALTPFVALAFLAAALGALWASARAASRGLGGAGRSRRRAAPSAGPWTRPWPDWLVGWWLGIVVYLVLVRRGNHEHDYYQMCLLPALAAGAGLGVEAWWRWIARPTRARRRPWASWRWPQWVTVALAVVSLAYAELQAYHKHKLALDSLVAGRAVAAVRQDDEKTLVYELGGLRHQQILYYTGGRGWLLPEDLKALDELKPYRERGARYLTVSMRTDEWAQDLYPLPLVRQWAQEGHLKEIARSGAQLDRYDRPRTWAVWRIEE